MKSFDEYVIEFLASYDAVCLHVAPAISQKRMQSATMVHGVDPRDRVWAIVDATIMGHTSAGSADKGMSITASGIYWKNPWMTKSRITRYSWADLVGVANTMEVAGGNLRFAPGVEFYTPANFKAAHLINLLQAMVRLYLDHREAGGADEQPAVPAASPVASGPMLESGTSYARTAGTCLGLMVCHAGEADEACAALAIELLSAEEAEHSGALTALSEAIEQLEREAKRSTTFLKLMQAKMLSQIFKPPVVEAERITIMCEAVSEVANTRAVDEVLGRIKQALST